MLTASSSVGFDTLELLCPFLLFILHYTPVHGCRVFGERQGLTFAEGRSSRDARSSGEVDVPVKENVNTTLAAGHLRFATPPTSIQVGLHDSTSKEREE